MSGTSTKTVVVGVRLPVDVAKKAQSNVARRKDQGEEGLTLSKYLGGLLVKQIGRKR